VKEEEEGPEEEQLDQQRLDEPALEPDEDGGEHDYSDQDVEDHQPRKCSRSWLATRGEAGWEPISGHPELGSIAPRNDFSRRTGPER
jgi:hypothetical protein